MLPSPLLLAIDALGLEAWQMHEHSIVRVAAFGAGESTALRSWLAGRGQRMRCRILVNLADEAYPTEDLPPVRGADRRALIARRMAAWFPHPEFARAHALGPAPDGRKGFERILFAGLERADELRPWLEAVRAAGNRITHLIPAANLMPAVLARATGGAVKDAGPQLVAGFGRAGLRITLVVGGAAHFSRLVGHCTLADAAHSPAWRQEIERTRDYLLAQRRVRGATHVPVQVLATRTALAAMADAPAEVRAALGAGASMDASGTGMDDGGRGALMFLPAATAPEAAPDGAAPLPFDRMLLLALARAPSALGWRAPRGPGEALPFAPRLLALAGLVAASAIGAGLWHLQQEAAAADAAARSRPTAPTDTAEPAWVTALPEPAIDATQAHEPAAQDIAIRLPEPPPPCPPATAPSPAVPVLAPPVLAVPPPLPRRIDGILLRADGDALVWLDGRLMHAHEAGLRAAAGGEPALSPTGRGRQRLRTGDHWSPPPPASAPAAASAAPAAPAAFAPASPAPAADMQP